MTDLSLFDAVNRLPTVGEYSSRFTRPQVLHRLGWTEGKLDRHIDQLVDTNHEILNRERFSGIEIWHLYHQANEEAAIQLATEGRATRRFEDGDSPSSAEQRLAAFAATIDGDEEATSDVGNAPKEGVIYVVQGLKDGPVKIGFTSYNDISSRIAGLQTGNPHPLRALATARGTQRQEMEAHKALAAERMSGEWFEWSARTIAFVERLLSHGLVEAISSAKAMVAPTFPKGWDTLWIAESSIAPTLSLVRGDIIPRARKTGNGPPFSEVQRNGRLTRYYRLDHLHVWLGNNKLSYTVHTGLWVKSVVSEG